MSADWWSRAPGGAVDVRVKVAPKASRAGLGGVLELPDGAALKVAVTAAPEDGKANAAVIALMAKRLGVAKSAITLIAGATDRVKRLRIDDPDGAVAARLATVDRS